MNADGAVTRIGVAAYRSTRAVGMDPARMVALGFDGLSEYLRRAYQGFESGDVSARAQALDRAFRVVEHLLAALDFEAGGELAMNLEGLYRFLLDRLARANIFNDPELLAECRPVVENLRLAWNEVAGNGDGSA